ncbi:MAG: hypothetical protein CML33_02925 [Rhodobacteraceae bacterium]|nr:hypothetical protein [Paracoccaceae bacterium]|tara:strand:+ start:805 stop:1032 length:228 start_codon:yes stop_codon:yes gene_type:complete
MSFDLLVKDPKQPLLQENQNVDKNPKNHVIYLLCEKDSNRPFVILLSIREKIFVNPAMDFIYSLPLCLIQFHSNI